ncbi:MAG: cation-translocating P-type ATPase [Deltaproteobacteria bacterium]|nr:cation-translocating P-type ATPase [Deltaproteobacteria bacterium]
MHDIPASEALSQLGSRPGGLTAAEVFASPAGPNALPESKRSLVSLVKRQFQDVLVYILFVALALSIAAPVLEHEPLTWRSFLDAYVIGAILLLNAALGFVQEYKAEEAIAELARLGAPHARVRRGGVEQDIASRELVPGDVVQLEAGDRVSADARILTSSHLAVDESSLTGESMPVRKSVAPVAANAPVAERSSMLYSGTLVTRGSAEAVVVATGLSTETGRIAELVGGTVLPETPLQRRLRRLGFMLGGVVLVLTAIVVVAGLVQGLPLIEVLLVGVSLAVSAVPEGLPAVVTVCFALGVRRMAHEHALVRRLDSLETLGSVTVICADKTGTITGNRMTVVRTSVAQDGDGPLLAEIAACCNHAALPNLGDPTEVALLRWADKEGATRLSIDDEEVPFSSEEKYMRTRHGERSFLKGSPERIALLVDDGGDAIDAAADSFAARGLRVLAGAVHESGRTRYVGLWGLEDPPRDGVRTAVEEARAAGIRSVMITGDSPATARSIAAQVGIDATRTLVGNQLDTLTEPELLARVRDTSVFARVAPEHKIAILQALQAQGEIVSMSGDGVNDAPALKGAHVGVAMGDRGTEVAREAASVVLADDHFATIVAAIREGRRLHDNIRKFVLFLLRANFDELLLILAAVALKLPLPFLPIHILWLNLMTDGLPALALGTEPAEPDVMQRPPRPHDEGLLSGEWPRLIGMTLLSFTMVGGWFWWQNAQGVDLDHARSTTLTLTIGIELLMAMSARSRLPVVTVGLLGNRWLLAAIAVVLCVHLLLLYTPLAVAFHLVPISLADWGRVSAVACAGFVLFEASKLVGLTRRDDPGDSQPPATP